MSAEPHPHVPSWFTQQLDFLAEKAPAVLLTSGFHAPMLMVSGGRRGPIETILLAPWTPETRPSWRAKVEALVALGTARALFHVSEAWSAEGPAALAYHQHHSLASYAERVEILMLEGVCRQGQANRFWKLIREQSQEEDSRLLRVEPWVPEWTQGMSYLFDHLPWPEPGGAS